MTEMTTEMGWSAEALERVHAIGRHYAVGVWQEKLGAPAWETLLAANSEDDARRRFKASGEWQVQGMIAERLGVDRREDLIVARRVEGYCIVDVSIEDDETVFGKEDETEIVMDEGAHKRLVGEFGDAESAFEHRDDNYPDLLVCLCGDNEWMIET